MERQATQANDVTQVFPGFFFENSEKCQAQRVKRGKSARKSRDEARKKGIMV